MPLPDLTRHGPLLSAPWRSGCEPVPDGDCFVSHTVFRFDRWRDLPRIGLAAQQAARLFRRTPGSVVLAQWILPGDRLMGDLSVWRSEVDLQAFLACPGHLALVSAWRGRMRGEHHHWTAPADREAIWRRAVPLIRWT